MRSSILFQRSYLDSIEALDKKDQVKAFDAIFNYAFKGKELASDTPVQVLRVFESAKTMIDEDNRRYDRRKEG